MASIASKAKKSSGGLVSPKTVANTKKATIQPTKSGTAQSVNPITTVLAKKSSGIIEKISVQAGAKNTRSIATGTAEAAMEHAFTKEALLVKQAKKTTTRKQGGVRFGTLNEKQLKTLANRQEAGPSSVE